MPAWKDARVRKEGLKNTKPRILPASARGSGWSLQGLGEREQIEDLLAR